MVDANREPRFGSESAFELFFLSFGTSLRSPGWAGVRLYVILSLLPCGQSPQSLSCSPAGCGFRSSPPSLLAIQQLPPSVVLLPPLRILTPLAPSALVAKLWNNNFVGRAAVALARSIFASPSHYHIPPAWGSCLRFPTLLLRESQKGESCRL